MILKKTKRKYLECWWKLQYSSFKFEQMFLKLPNFLMLWITKMWFTSSRINEMTKQTKKGKPSKYCHYIAKIVFDQDCKTQVKLHHHHSKSLLPCMPHPHQKPIFTYNLYASRLSDAHITSYHTAISSNGFMVNYL